MTEPPDLADVTEELLARQPETDMVPTLDRVARVMELLGDPQRSPRIVHITGTNGKTSTARMIETLVLSSGLRVGTFTSPHLNSVTERIRVDGHPIGAEEFVASYEDIRPVIDIVDTEQAAEDRPALTFFEVLTCIAFAAFADAPVDVAIIEVGLGGRWDATNVADADVAVITPVALDHEVWLGHTIEQIAAEKAGIIKPRSIAVIGHQDPTVMALLLQRCADVGAAARVVGRDIDLVERVVAVGGQVLGIRTVTGQYDEVFLGLHGGHQADNAVLAVAAVEALLVSHSALDSALVDAIGSVTSPGRLEVVAREPTVLIDSAHNPAGARALAQAVRDSFTFPDLTLVLAAMADKDVAGIMSALRDVADRVVVTRNNSWRSCDPQTMAELAAAVWGADHVDVEPDLAEALTVARRHAEQTGGGVLVTGSVVTAGDARTILGAEEPT
ncbi:MAG: folylpolyglutamate synthase/dihydrofolate synthase family protein [Candidatus Nanopelagicales bacterium]